KVHDPPLMLAYVCLLDHDPSTLVEPTQNSPAKIHILIEVAFELRHARLGNVNPDLPRHFCQRLGFEIGWIELRIWRKGEFLHLPRWPLTAAHMSVQKCAGKGPKHF